MRILCTSEALALICLNRTSLCLNSIPDEEYIISFTEWNPDWEYYTLRILVGFLSHRFAKRFRNLLHL